MEPILLKIVALSPLAQAGVLSIGTLVSFLVAYFKNDVTIYLPFISENGAIIPEIGIFSATLIAGSFIGLITVSYRALVLYYILVVENRPKFDKIINVLHCLCGMGSMAGLAGVAAFPMSTVLVVHLIVAGIHFVLALVYLWMDVYISNKIKSSTYKPPLMKLRLAMCVFLSVFLVLLTFVMPFGHFKWKRLHPSVLPALKTPDDEGFTLLFVSALCEWLLYITFLTYVLTFLKEFRKFQLKFSVEPIAKDDGDLKERL